jgi:hypothetical protein
MLRRGLPGPTITGRPGVHARQLAMNALARQAAALAGIGVLATATAFILAATPPSTLRVVELILGIAGVLSLVGPAVRADVRRRQAWAGYSSERRVAAVLNRLPVAEVAHGLMLGAGGDADHVVLGPCAVLVETKTGNGRVAVTGRGLAVGRRVMPKDPLAQARRQARVLGQRAGVWVQAVVCVPGMTNASFVDDGVTVCSLADLPRVIGAAPAAIDAFAARAFLASLQGLPAQYEPPAGSVRKDGPSRRSRERVAMWSGRASKTPGDAPGPARRRIRP